MSESATPAVTPAPTPAAPAVPPAPPPAPEWHKYVPEKFRAATPEETLAKLGPSYSELEKFKGTAKPAEQPKTDAAKSAEGVKIPDAPALTTPEIPDDAGVDTILKAAGLDIKDTTAAYIKDGKLTDDQYAALRKSNSLLTKTVVNEFLSAQRANAALAQVQSAQFQSQAAALAGGEQKLQLLLQSAAGMDKDKKAELNARLAKNDLGAIKELMVDFGMSNGTAGSRPLVSASGAAPGSASGFATATEMHTAMQEAKKKFGSWDKDPSFMARYNNTPQAVRSKPRD